ncbi:MAG: hypothetical protein BGN86_15565 [Caulobacterales bacterium 68-7]|nr:MAG: hypothetical protein BGN86_15565 [Caulobacterales bacterium 68-7]
MADDAYLDRFRLSAGVDYVLRLMRIYTDLVGGDPTLALVFIAAAQAQTQHLNRRNLELREGDFVSDGLRRPVSLSALARSLGLPVETTRRHVVRLTQLGLVERTEAGGVRVTSRQLDRAELREAVLENNVNLSKFLQDLAQTPSRKNAGRAPPGVHTLHAAGPVGLDASASQGADDRQQHDGAEGGDHQAADEAAGAEAEKAGEKAAE